jgi:hypothetical protein
MLPLFLFQLSDSNAAFEEDAGGDAGVLAEYAGKQVLGRDQSVVETLSLLGGIANNELTSLTQRDLGCERDGWLFARNLPDDTGSDLVDVCLCLQQPDGERQIGSKEPEHDVVISVDSLPQWLAS